MERAIYVITGVMASGKSTVAEALARKLDKCVHLRGDIFRRMIVTGRQEMCENPSKEALRQLDMRYSIAAKVAIEYYNNGFTVVVQDNFLEQKLSYFVDLLKPCPTYVIVLNPDIETIKKREQMRDKKGYIGFTVESLYKTFIEETPNEILKRAGNEAKYR